MAFHGSYHPDDVTFLLRPAPLQPVPTAERERLMQSGERHYSALLPPEAPPSPAYMAHYHTTLDRNGAKVGRHVAALALALAERRQAAGHREVVLVSLARAGTPVGVLLRRALVHLGVQAPHYSVSIIRDRGIDGAALDHILACHEAASLVFVDGWTGKGAIRGTLTEALAEYNAARGVAVPDTLVVLADLAGVADLAATDEDYVLPSAILNAVVSGLVSRTVLLPDADEGYHLCRHYTEWAERDVSRGFVDAVTRHVEEALDAGADPAAWPPERREGRRALSERCVMEAMARYGVRRRNRIKPGAGEATRAVLRRVPHAVVVRDPEDLEVAHLMHLCAERGVPVEVWPAMAYRAMTVIKPVA